jgi:hypothetical protein
MEQTLDDIATGEAQRLPYLNEFYHGSDGLVDQVKAKEESIDPRTACTLQLDGLTPAIRVGRYGPYFEMQTNGDKITVSIPDSVAPADITNADAERMMREKAEGPKALGIDPETSEPIYVRNGPFGPYIQRGEMRDDGTKPKRVSIPKNIDSSSVTPEIAQTLLSLPRKLGDHPETHKTVKAGIGRFGPYVVYDGIYKSFNKDGTYDLRGTKVRRAERRPGDRAGDARHRPPSSAGDSAARTGAASRRRQADGHPGGALRSIHQTRQSERHDSQRPDGRTGDRRGSPCLAREKGRRQGTARRPRPQSPRSPGGPHHVPRREETRCAQARSQKSDGDGNQKEGEKYKEVERQEKTRREEERNVAFTSRPAWQVPFQHRADRRFAPRRNQRDRRSSALRDKTPASREV